MLNFVLEKISQCAFRWKMSFNPDPTKPAEGIVFSRKHARAQHPPLFFNNIMVKLVNEHKHLGFILDSKLTFVNHIPKKISKSRKGIGVIKYLSSYVPAKTLDQIYKMYVRPHLDLCDAIYHIPEIDSLFVSSSRLLYWMNSIEILQYKAALTSTGSWQGANTENINEELGWESLSKRRWFRRLIQIFKIQNNYLKEQIPSPRTYTISTRGARNVNLIPLNAKTDYYRNSFFPDTISILGM